MVIENRRSEVCPFRIVSTAHGIKIIVQKLGGESCLSASPIARHPSTTPLQYNYNEVLITYQESENNNHA